MKGFSVSLLEGVWQFAYVAENDAWRQVEMPAETREQLMTEIQNGFREHELEGFTLFWNWTKKHWQMSVRRKGETGWSISHISEEQAAAILSMLETSGHPDGPWTVKPMPTIATHITMPVTSTSEGGHGIRQDGAEIPRLFPETPDLLTALSDAAEARAALTENLRAVL